MRRIVLAASLVTSALSFPLPATAEEPQASAPVSAAQPDGAAATAARPARRRDPSGRAWWTPVADRGWLGVRLSNRGELLQALDAERLPVEWMTVPNLLWLEEQWDGEGALIQEVLSESPAEKAGLLPGDVILSFNGIRTQSPGVLVFVVQRAVKGHDGDIEVLRDGDKRRVLVEIGMHPEDARRLEEEREAQKQEAAREQPKP